MLNKILLWVFFLPGVTCTGVDVWGFQNDGRDGMIDVDDEGYVYYAGQKYYSTDYFVSKISSQGKLVWTYYHTDPHSYLEIARMGFGPDSVYLIGNYPQTYITKLHRHNGSFIWERKNFVNLNDTSSVTMYGVIVDRNNDPYILFHRQPYGDWWLYESFDHSRKLTSIDDGETNDYVIKLSGATSDVLWEVNCKTDFASKVDFNVFNVIQPNNDNSFDIVGQYYNYEIGKEVFLLRTLTYESGEIISTKYLIAAIPEKNPFRVKYNNDEYNLRLSGKHRYGKDTTVKYGYVINKNWCPDGYHLVPSSSTTSVVEECPGISWSLNDHKGYQLDCTYYYGRCGLAGLLIIFLFPILLIYIVSRNYKIESVHVLSAMLSSLVFSVDFSYLIGVVFYNLKYFLLAFLFLMLPSIHLFQYLYHAGRSRRIRLLFNPPGTMTPLLAISSRDGGVPYFREFRCLPESVQPSEDFILLAGGWILAGFAQLLYAIIWVISHIIPLLPWLLVHTPWYLLIFLLGYLLYRFGLLQHRPIKERWFRLFFVEESLEDSNSLPTSDDIESSVTEGEDMRPNIKIIDISGELIITSISILLFGLIGGLVIQLTNNKKMHDRGFIPVICLIFKCLFLLNILNRIVIVYGNNIFPQIRSIFFSLIPNYVPPTTFTEIQSEENTTLDPVELQNQVHELQLLVQSLRSKLSKYEAIDDEHKEGVFVIDSLPPADESRSPEDESMNASQSADEDDVVGNPLVDSHDTNRETISDIDGRQEVLSTEEKEEEDKGENDDEEEVIFFDKKTVKTEEDLSTNQQSDLVGSPESTEHHDHDVLEKNSEVVEGTFDY